MQIDLNKAEAALLHVILIQEAEKPTNAEQVRSDANVLSRRVERLLDAIGVEERLASEKRWLAREKQEGA